jgi:predicted RNase H-like HicB family nuclease
MFSRSKSVETEVLRRLPATIRFEFRAEFDDNNNPVIFISAPDYSGLISEAVTFDEAIANACDAILTYFDIPREYANLVEYELQQIERQPSLLSGEEVTGLKHVVLNRHNLACA